MALLLDLTQVVHAEQVAVRCRPLTRKERSLGCHLITRLVEDKVRQQTAGFLVIACELGSPNV